MSQQNQYNQMLQQMMMNKQRPSPYSPAPYANGGNVALRRKMFKLGGSASSHGTGLTSGLAFNEGGRVNMDIGGRVAEALDKIREAGKKAKPTSKKGIALKGLGYLTDFLIPGSVSLGRRIAKPSLIKTGSKFGTGAATLPLFGGAALGIGALKPGGLESFVNQDPDTTLERLENLGPKAGQLVGELTTEVPARLLDALLSVNVPDDPDGRSALSKALGGEGDLAKGVERALYGREKTPEEASQDQKENVLGKTVAQLQAEADVKQREDLQAAMEMYQELIRGEDNTNKLMTLGDAAIAAGSALMEGEGYGAAATAFNEPLAQARMTQAERDQTAQSAAAQLAIGEDMSRRQADEALFNQLAAEGQLDSAEEIRNYMLATKFGVSKRVPEDEKGELDLEAMKAAGPAVYGGPKIRLGGLFIAFDGEKYQRFNSAEEAQQYTES